MGKLKDDIHELRDEAINPLLKLISVLLPSVLVTLGSVLRKVVKTKDGRDNIF
jgi:hypothetical protein